MKFSGLEKNIYNLRHIHLLECQNLKTKRYDLDFTAYRAFSNEIRLNFAKNFQTQNKNIALQFVSMLQSLHSPLRIYLKVH